MGLDVALVGGSGAEAALHHPVGPGEAGFHVAVSERAAAGDVAGEVRGHVVAPAPLVQHRCAGRHGGVHVGHVGQDLVVDDDSPQRLPCHPGAHRGHGRHGVTVVEDPAVGHAVVQHVAVGFVLHGREVRRRHHGLDPAQASRGRGVDGADSRVGVRTSQDPAHQHPRQREVCAEAGTTGHLVHAVGARWTPADYPEGALLPGAS